MGRQVAFWIGFFAAGLLIVPIAVGIWGASEEFARQIAVFLFGAACVLVVLLVLVLFFRDAILRRLTGQTEVALTDVVSSLIAGVSAASAGDRTRAEAEAQRVIGRAMGLYAWSNFYRWVIATALGLLLAFGAFVGTVMLFEQTRTLRLQTERLGEQTQLMAAQNELMSTQTERLNEQAAQSRLQAEMRALSLVKDLREQLVAATDDIALDQIFRAQAGLPSGGISNSAGDNRCFMRFEPDTRLKTLPNASTLQRMEELASNPDLGPRVIRALQSLTQDSDGSVALGAALVLRAAGEVVRTKPVRASNVYAPNLTLKPGFAVELDRSVLVGLTCPVCEVYLNGSIVADFQENTLIKMNNSIAFRAVSRFPIVIPDDRGLRSYERNRILYLDFRLEGEEERQGTPNRLGQRHHRFTFHRDNGSSNPALLAPNTGESDCAAMEGFATLNPFVAHYTK
ncbi:MAG: hypothetical protein AAF744_06105 [Pseudomonadota bacterium]